MDKVINWLLSEGDPWVRLGVYCDLLNLNKDDERVLEARAAVFSDPRVQGLLRECESWPAHALKRHNDASHPIHKMNVLVNIGLRAGDPGIDSLISQIRETQAPSGPYQTLVNIQKNFGGMGEDQLTWILCDTPLLLHFLLAAGAEIDDDMHAAIAHLESLVSENGFRCVAAPELGKFRGPGKKSDPCPIATLYALKALALAPGGFDSEAAALGIEMLLTHWKERGGPKLYMFGIGTTYQRLKYPLVWYDILHVLDVLSCFPSSHADPRYREMLGVLEAQADEDDRFTAGSMFMAWKGWEFADKKTPSPMITYLARRIFERSR